MGQFRFGEAKLNLFTKVKGMSSVKFISKLHPDNIVDAKLQIEMSDGTVVELDADILELLWRESDE